MDDQLNLEQGLDPSGASLETLDALGLTEDFVQTVLQDAAQESPEVQEAAQAVTDAIQAQQAAVLHFVETGGLAADSTGSGSTPASTPERRQQLAAEARQLKVASRPANTTSTYLCGLRHYLVSLYVP